MSFPLIGTNPFYKEKSFQLNHWCVTFGWLNTSFALLVIKWIPTLFGGFPHSLVGKESACNIGDPGLNPGSGRSPGEGNGNPLQYSCLENPMDRGAWQATVHRVARVRHRLASKPLYFW